MTQDMQKHIRITSKIMIVLGALYLVVAVLFGLLGLLATYNHIQAGDQNVALLPTMLTGVIIVTPMLLFGILHIMTGRAFRTGANWSRITMWILAILNLGNVPLGTAFGAYAIWVLVKTREQVKEMQ